MIATGGAPTLSSSSLKTRPICGESPMILKKFRVTLAHETRSASRPGMPLRLRDSLWVAARYWKTVSSGPGQDYSVALPIEIVWQRDRVILTRAGRFIQHHDPIGIWIRQRPQQDCVDYAKDGGVCADSQRQRDRGYGS